MQRVHGPGGIQWLEFPLLAAAGRVRHASFLRQGNFNLGETATGVDAQVALNRSRATTALDAQHLCMVHQVHGSDIIDVTQPLSQTSAPFGDALITNRPGLALLVKHADCQGALFYDPVQHVIAAAHCGWRGNVANIYGKLVERLKTNYGCKPENLLVGISPSLGPDNAQFIHYRTELPESFWPYQVRPLYFDLWTISEMQLYAAGILPQHIQMARICTYANADDCYSYRRNQVEGRHGSAIVLREPSAS